MPKKPRDETALSVRTRAPALAPAPAPALGSTTVITGQGPQLPVRRAVSGLLQGTVDAFGDVVDALICDLDSTTEGLEQIAWLGSTRAVLEREQSWQAALVQLQWWDQFLSTLPSPELISERRRAEVQQHRALRARALLHARDAALAAHRELVGEPMADPAPSQWRVDLAAYEAQALAALPPAPHLVPIVAADLDAAHSFAGFNAVHAMRSNADLGSRAAHLDAVIAATLQEELHLKPKAAQRHAQALTGIFWIALRRALGVGSHQLASAISLLATADHGPVQEQFTKELLLSWLAYLQELPASDQKRLGGLRGLLTADAPRQLTDDAPSSAPGVWGRLKKGLGIK